MKLVDLICGVVDKTVLLVVAPSVVSSKSNVVVSDSVVSEYKVEMSSVVSENVVDSLSVDVYSLVVYVCVVDSHGVDVSGLLVDCNVSIWSGVLLMVVSVASHVVDCSSSVDVITGFVE